MDLDFSCGFFGSNGTATINVRQSRNRDRTVVRLRMGLVSLGLLLGACSVGPNYTSSPVAALAVPAQYTLRVQRGAQIDLTDWWRQFDDPLLTDLIGRATTANLDIAVSAARLRQAREALVQARATLLPTVTGSAGETHTIQYARSGVVNGIPKIGGSSAIDDLSLGLDASWQADIFGGNPRAGQAARASAAEAQFDLIGVRTSVAAEVAYAGGSEAGEFDLVGVGRALIAEADGVYKVGSGAPWKGFGASMLARLD